MLCVNKHYIQKRGALPLMQQSCFNKINYLALPDY